MSISRIPKSPYQRKQKSPHVYSAAYQLWRKAALNDGASSQKALDLSCQHAKYVGVKHYTAEGQFANDCV